MNCSMPGFSFTISWICSSSRPLSWWYHPTVSFSVSPVSSSPQSYPASESFPMSQLFTSGSQSLGASTSVLPIIQGLFPSGLTGLISLLSKGPSRLFSSIAIQKHQFFWKMAHSHFYGSTLKSYMTTGKTIAFTVWAFVHKVMCLLFNTLSRFVRAFLSRSKFLIYECSHTLLWWVEPKKIKAVTGSTFPPFAMKWWDWMPWSLFFEHWVLSQVFHCPLSPSSRGLLVTLCFLPLEWYHLNIWGYYFSQQYWLQLVIHPTWHFAWCTLHMVIWCKELTHLKRPYAGKDWRWEEKGMTEDEMVGWHHRLNGYKLE